MGYRSDVTAGVFFESHEHNIESIVKYQHRITERGERGVFDISTELKKVTLDNRPGYSVEVSGWKWYRGYEEIDAFERFMDFMRDECGAATVFIRIGEDANDVEFEVCDSQLDGLKDLDLWGHYGIERSIVAPTFTHHLPPVSHHD